MARPRRALAAWAAAARSAGAGPARVCRRRRWCEGGDGTGHWLSCHTHSGGPRGGAQPCSPAAPLRRDPWAHRPAASLRQAARRSQWHQQRHQSARRAGALERIAASCPALADLDCSGARALTAASLQARRARAPPACRAGRPGRIARARILARARPFTDAARAAVRRGWRCSCRGLSLARGPTFTSDKSSGGRAASTASPDRKPIRDADGRTARALRQAATAAGRLGGLTRLALARCDGVAGAGPALAALTALVDLDLSGTAASDADLAALVRAAGARSSSGRVRLRVRVRQAYGIGHA